MKAKKLLLKKRAEYGATMTAVKCDQCGSTKDLIVQHEIKCKKCLDKAGIECDS